MADRYWVGGSGTWNTTSTTNWSTASGGGSGASVPTVSDNVIFDQAGTYTVTMTGALACLDITVSAGTVTFATGTSPTLNIRGSMTLLISSFSNSWSFNQLNAKGAQLVAHGRIDARVAAGDFVPRLARQCGQAAHESPADSQNMYVHRRYFRQRGRPRPIPWQRLWACRRVPLAGAAQAQLALKAPAWLGAAVIFGPSPPVCRLVAIACFVLTIQALLTILLRRVCRRRWWWRIACGALWRLCL